MARLRSSTLIACIILAAASFAGCGSDDSSSTSSDGGSSDSTTTASAALPQGDEVVEIDPDEFGPVVDNEFLPLEPGTQLTYRETDEDGAELTVVVTVSSETKQISNGVTARVVRDTASVDGEIIEDTLDWYAQDADGTVWYMGEDTAEFEAGDVTSRDGSWEAGVDGALPGVIMPANPADGMAYRQEYYQGEAEDNGEVIATGEQAEVPAGHYDDVVVTKDWISIEPDVLEFKLYAPEVGMVLALGISGGAGREELVGIKQVSDAVAERAGTAALGEPYE